MIRSFRDKDLERFWLSKGIVHVKCVPADLRKATYRKLRELDNVRDSRDLRSNPSNHFEKLEGKQHLGYHSIRISKQYRLIFIWQNNNAYEVEINKHDKKY
ncbi:MAG: type II toxin-antitoxin system RelE/ParE family toxin [Candidatus Moeniiplasma glomeromycotorum]|nr:type II toxin-antitoxin system RelE/ParE family toxin [Candidatus Moeniiplasma glomeromycotorum]MCE8167577.1 type II toxin-antitoxin system RelE/ParE family toxin [Candidatus Moeniiplasma glomeromycotorum]MCE8169071.1 type II toxin-antitoxin system RelE/ParE family toxin [Candidatus Moeniiplasma glomeromycotorum]